ncbi:unnamed protein product [Chrysodeixis includens]|uniref:Uncharacterized protein n=1 Tax=Chrysodeixis includens TaxID=689277 RepID=A0A9P0BMF1_CHRIL|nr:unnamed protein product [Chrysodeixis includens]
MRAGFGTWAARPGGAAPNTGLPPAQPSLVTPCVHRPPVRQQNTDNGNTFISQKLYLKHYLSTKRSQLSLSVNSIVLLCLFLYFYFSTINATKHLANYAYNPATSVLHHT